MERLIENIKFYTTLSEPETQLLQNSVDKKIYHKNEVIFTEGKVSEEIYFVTKGCVRLFYNVDGNDKTAFFILKDNLYVLEKAIHLIFLQ
jgi:CRP/FNR family transcriptional regulator, anaerobic regulatory protein